MTATGDYVPFDTYTQPNYPTVFGITFTPAVSGAVAAVVGLGLAAYLGTQLVAPAFQQFQELQTSITTKEAELQQKTALVQQLDQIVASVNRAKAENAQVRTLFSTQAALNTLLLDLNRLIVQNNAELVTFTPNYALSGPVTDGSVGPELNGKLKRQVTDVAFRGTFPQTVSIMQNLDRLQTLVVVRDLKSELVTGQTQGLPSNTVLSSFKLYAYVPLTPEEIAAQAAQQAQQAPPADGQTPPATPAPQ